METDEGPASTSTAGTAARVRAVIADAGVSQREFARRVVMDPSKLSRALSGTRRFTVAELARIADEGRVDADWLLGTRPRERETAPAVHVEGGRPLQIVRETVRLIAEHGFHAVRVADIARACATSSAAIHYHFPGRAELLEAAVRWCMDEDTARRAAHLAEADDAAAELRQLIALQTPRTAQQRRQWAVWLDLWAEAARSTAVGRLHSEYYRQWRETVTDVLRRGAGQGVFRAGTDPHAAALTLTALIDGLATHVLSVSGPESVTAADAMHRTLTTHITHTILAP